MKKLVLIFAFSSIVWACKKDDPTPVTIGNAQVELKYDQEHQFTLMRGSDTVSPAEFSWKSSDEKVGTIDASGNFKGKRIGETTVTGTAADGQSVSSQVTISPYSTLTKEPVLEFGTNRDNIEKKETRKLTLRYGDGDGITKTLTFAGENAKVRSLVYVFKNDQLTSVRFHLETNSEVAKESAVFYSERYSFVKQEGDIYVLSDLEKTTVGLQVHPSLGLIANYTPYVKGGRLNFEKLLGPTLEKAGRQAPGGKLKELGSILNNSIKLSLEK